MVQVSAALIWKGNRFLICRRPENKARALLWEFPGGKVEPGESEAEAVIRECREELDIQIEPGPLFMALTHEYPDLTVRLTLYHARIVEGTPRLLEHTGFCWITPREIPDFSFCPADAQILSRLQQGVQPWPFHACDSSGNTPDLSAHNHR